MGQALCAPVDPQMAKGYREPLAKTWRVEVLAGLATCERSIPRQGDEGSWFWSIGLVVLRGGTNQADKKQS